MPPIGKPPADIRPGGSGEEITNLTADKISSTIFLAGDRVSDVVFIMESVVNSSGSLIATLEGSPNRGSLWLPMQAFAEITVAGALEFLALRRGNFFEMMRVNLAISSGDFDVTLWAFPKNKESIKGSASDLPELL